MSDEHEENLTRKAPLLTDEMKEYERRNVLSNQIRTYFFGADFGTIRQLLAQYKDQQVIEFNTERTALSGEQLEKLEREEQTQNSRYDVLLRLLDRLEYPQIPLTHEDITHFGEQLYSLKEDKVGQGQAQKFLDDVFQSAGSYAGTRANYEVDNHYNIPFEDLILRQQWNEKLQEFFRAADPTDRYGVGVELSEQDVEKSLKLRVGQAVTAIYSGKLELPGLQIGDYTKDEMAPYKTAQTLVRALGVFAFLDESVRGYYIPPDIVSGYRKGNFRLLPEETMDDIVLNGNYEPLALHASGETTLTFQVSPYAKRLKGKEKDYLEAIGAYVNGEAPKDRWEEFRPDFEKLGKIKENTELNGHSIDAEETLFQEVADKWLPEQFESKVSKYWWNGLHHSMATVGETELEKAIAAHLCSAHEQYQEGSSEISKDVLTLPHVPGLPINDASIRETIAYFKDNCKNLCREYPNLNEAFSAIDPERIRLYYDSAILSREAKLQEADLPESTPNRKFQSYLLAMKEIFSLSDAIDFNEQNERLTTVSSMISRMDYPGKDNKWYAYVKDLIQNNDEFKEAINEKIHLGSTEPNIDNLTGGFVDRYKADVSSHQAKVRLWENERATEARSMTYRTRREIMKTDAYRNGIEKLDGAKKQIIELGLLTDPAKYNSSQNITNQALRDKARQNGQVVIAEQEKQNAAITERHQQLHKDYQTVSPGATPKEMLNMLVLSLGGGKEAAEAKQNIMDCSKQIKRNVFMVIFDKFKKVYQNEASTRMRTLLDGLAAKGPDDEVSRKELLNLRKAADDLKLSIDHGQPLTAEQTKKLRGIDQRRYALANKVSAALDEAFIKNGENVLFQKKVEKLKELAAPKQQKQPKQLKQPKL